MLIPWLTKSKIKYVNISQPLLALQESEASTVITSIINRDISLFMKFLLKC